MTRPRAVRPRAPRLVRRAGAAALRRLGWSRAVPPPTVGVVEEFSKVLAVGWVAVPAGSPPVRVALHLGRTEVASAWAANPVERAVPGEAREFRFKVRGIWDYARRSTRISVRVDGRPLPIAGHGMYLRPTRNGKQSVQTLTERLASGYVFSQTGQLQLSRRLDTAWQREVIGLYDGVRAVLAEDFGYDAFVVYGSMLGAVREGGFIGHDLDFDAAYVSRHTVPGEAGAELATIALRLIERGFDVESQRIALHIHALTNPQIRIDLFHLYFDDSGVLSFPFGVAGSTDVRVEDWRGVAERDFGAHRVLAPVNAEEVVEAIYGAGWRQPNPGFSWARDRTKKAHDAFIPPEGAKEIRAANHAARAGGVR